MLGAARKSSERLPELARGVIAMRESSEQISAEIRVESNENADD
jgi:hypothetical protein